MTAVFFPTLVVTDAGRELVKKMKEMFPETFAELTTIDEEAARATNKKEDIKPFQTVQEEIFEVVATIMASSATGIVPETKEDGTPVQAPTVPAWLICEATIILLMTMSLSHVKEKDIIQRTIHTKMHSQGAWQHIYQALSALISELEKEHIKKIIARQVH